MLFALRGCLWILIWVLCGPTAHSYNNSNEELTLRPYGIRAMGMGYAFTAMADDSSATYFNPAGLSGHSIQFGFFDQDLSRRQYGIDFTRSLQFETIAYTERRLNADYLSSWSIGFQTANGLDYGLSFKQLQTAQSQMSVDFGILAHVFEDSYLGLNFINIINTGQALKPSYRLGLQQRWQALTLSCDTVIEQTLAQNQAYVHMGAEFLISPGLSLRSGWMRGQYTAGLSLMFGILNLEYATILADQPEYGLAIKWGLDRKETDPETRKRYLSQTKEYVEIKISSQTIAGRGDFSILGAQHIGFDDLLPYFRLIREDSRIEGVLIHLQSLDQGISTVGWIEELRNELKRLQTLGKKIIIYLESGEAMNNTYYLASVADHLIIPPGGSVGLLGQSITITKLSGLFEKVGISWQIVKRGKFKDSSQPFNKSLSPEQRVELESVVQDLHLRMKEKILEDRPKIKDQLALNDAQILTADQAKESGWVDEIGYFPAALKKIDESLDINQPQNWKHRIIPLSYLSDPLASGDENLLMPMMPRIRVIEIDGEIVSGVSSRGGLFGGKTTGTETILAQIQEAISDSQTKGILLRINSPGGSALASDEIYEKLMEAKTKGKKIIASLGNLAASGGYYIAMAADKVISNRATLTGSIGVIGLFPNYNKFNEIFGINPETVQTDPHLDMFSGNRAFTETERAMLEKLMDDTYERFLKKVAESRKMKLEKLRPLAEGKIYTGQMAFELDLVDQIGDFEAAVSELMSLCKIETRYQLIWKKENSWSMNAWGKPVRESLRQLLGIPSEGIFYPATKVKMQQLQMESLY